MQRIKLKNILRTYRFIFLCNICQITAYRACSYRRFYVDMSYVGLLNNGKKALIR